MLFKHNVGEVQIANSFSLKQFILWPNRKRIFLQNHWSLTGVFARYINHHKDCNVFDRYLMFQFTQKLNSQGDILRLLKQMTKKFLSEREEN